MDQTLRKALLKLHGHQTRSASHFTVAQRESLDQFARQTGAVECQRQGCGYVYRISNPLLFRTHLNEASPGAAIPTTKDLPKRAKNIASARDSKAGEHRHEFHYLLLKSVGRKVFWRQGENGTELPLCHVTRQFGAVSLRIEDGDAWQSSQPLWMVENQALFDHTDWMPAGTKATLLYYSGNINSHILKWMEKRPRASRVILFPDYDGVGLSNFARLYARLGNACEFWLMPDWQKRLLRHGNNQLWLDTFQDFTNAVPNLPDYLKPLIEQMRQSGLALEQESIWLPVS